MADATRPGTAKPPSEGLWNILLPSLFYALVLPIGWLLRTFGASPIPLRFRRNAKSYWFRRAPIRNPARHIRGQG